MGAVSGGWNALQRGGLGGFAKYSIDNEAKALGATPPGAPKLPDGPGPAPDLTDDAVLQARRAAMRQLAAKRGVQSTFLTTPAAGSMLTGPTGGGYGSSS